VDCNTIIPEGASTRTPLESYLDVDVLLIVSLMMYRTPWMQAYLFVHVKQVIEDHVALLLVETDDLFCKGSIHE